MYAEPHVGHGCHLSESALSLSVGKGFESLDDACPEMVAVCVRKGGLPVDGADSNLLGKETASDGMSFAPQDRAFVDTRCAVLPHSATAITTQT